MFKNLGLIILGIVIGISVNSYFGNPLEQQAFAKVAGMNDWDLRDDWDFQDAVTYVVQDRCKISGERIICR